MVEIKKSELIYLHLMLAVTFLSFALSTDHVVVRWMNAIFTINHIVSIYSVSKMSTKKEEAVNAL